MKREAMRAGREFVKGSCLASSLAQRPRQQVLSGFRTGARNSRRASPMGGEAARRRHPIDVPRQAGGLTMTQGAWPDPRRMSRRGARSEAAPASSPPCARPFCGHAVPMREEWALRWRSLRVAFDAVGWPIFLVVALAFTPEQGLERAAALAIAMWLLIAERWRAAMQRREEADLDRFLRALDDGDDPYAATVGVPLSPPPPPPPLGSGRRDRARGAFAEVPPPSASVARRIASVNERPTAPQRPSERPTVPDSAAAIQLVTLEPEPDRPPRRR